MEFKKFDAFGFKVGMYHRLYMYSLPAGLLFIYFANTRFFGLFILLIALPIFWKLRNSALVKQQDIKGM
jgi:hypothetical protein